MALLRMGSRKKIVNTAQTATNTKAGIKNFHLIASP
jgi:hypothetical protein